MISSKSTCGTSVNESSVSNYEDFEARICFIIKDELILQLKTKSNPTMERPQDLGHIDSRTLADYILYRLGPMSHLKLQKLIYLIEGYHLAYFGQSLIDDDFEAWVHGPVSRNLYDALKDKSKIYGKLCYTPREGLSADGGPKLGFRLSGGQSQVIEYVLMKYGGVSGDSLEAITHLQTPWLSACSGVASDRRSRNQISRQEMIDFFVAEIKKEFVERIKGFKEGLDFGWNGAEELPMETESVNNAIAGVEAAVPGMLRGWNVFPSPNGTVRFAASGSRTAAISVGNTEFSYAAMCGDRVIKGRDSFSTDSFVNVLNNINTFFGNV